MFVPMRPDPTQRTATTGLTPGGGAAACVPSTAAAPDADPAGGFTSRTAARLAEVTGLASRGTG
jgi:hypothetical protein